MNPSPNQSKGTVPEQHKAWFDGLPEEAQKAAKRAELDKNLPVLASIMQEVGVAGICAWAAYLDLMETGNVDPFGIGEIIGAAVPTLRRSIGNEFEERLKEVERQRDRANEALEEAEQRIVLERDRAEDATERAEKAEAALAQRDQQVEDRLRAEARKLHKRAADLYESGDTAGADRLQAQGNSLRFAANVLANQPSSTPLQQDRENCDCDPDGHVAAECRSQGCREARREKEEPAIQLFIAERKPELPDIEWEELPEAERAEFMARARLQQDPEVGEDGTKSSGVEAGAPNEVDFNGRALRVNLRGGGTASVLGYVVSDDDDGSLQVMVRDEGTGFDRDDLLAALTQPEADPEVPRCGDGDLLQRVEAVIGEAEENGALVSPQVARARLLGNPKGCPKTRWDGPYKMRCGLGGESGTCSVHGAFVDEKLLRPFGFTLDPGPVVRANRNLIDALEWIEAETGEQFTRDAARRAIDAASPQPVSESPGGFCDQCEKPKAEVANLLEGESLCASCLLVRATALLTEAEGHDYKLTDADHCPFCGQDIKGSESPGNSGEPELDEQLAEERVRYEGLREIVDDAIPVIDHLFEFFATSGLSEEGGGLALHEASKPLADIRARLAEATQPVPGNSGGEEEGR